MILAEDTFFFFTHATLHYFTKLYKFIHKTHHEIDAPYSLMSEYASIIEYVFYNIVII